MLQSNQILILEISRNRNLRVVYKRDLLRYIRMETLNIVIQLIKMKIKIKLYRSRVHLIMTVMMMMMLEVNLVAVSAVPGKPMR